MLYEADDPNLLTDVALAERRVAQLEQWIAELMLNRVSDVPMDEETLSI